MSVDVTARPATGWQHRSVEAFKSRLSVEIGGALVALAVGAILFTRFSLQGTLSRDEGIYAYAGVQLTHGVAPYSSIFDPKGPLASFIAAFGAAIGRMLGDDPLLLIRVTFLAFSVLTVGAVYLLALQLWRSVTGALVGAVVFASFKGFAEDALPGPDAKTPGILFAVLAMWLAARRQWAWSAALGSLAALVWQPLAFYPLAAVIGAAAYSPGRRLRAFGAAAAAALAPVVATLIYFVAVGAVGRFVESTISYPLTGVRQGNETVWHRAIHIAWVVRNGYGLSGAVLFWGGLLLLLVVVLSGAAAQRTGGAALREPIVLIVLCTLIGEAAFALSNFQGNPDLFPGLPYAALGFAGAAAFLTRVISRPAAFRVTSGVALALALGLAVWSAQWYTTAPENDRGLRVERAMGCALNKMIVPGTPLYSLGSSVPLLLTGRRNPDRYVYLSSGVDRWKVLHTKGGFTGWMRQIKASDASVIVILGWTTELSRQTAHWLTHVARYHPGYVGQWRVFLTPDARQRARVAGIRVTRYHTKQPTTTSRTWFTQQRCVGNS